MLPRLTLAALGLAAGFLVRDLAPSPQKRIVRRVLIDALQKGDYRVFDESYDAAFRKHLGAQTLSLAEEREDARSTHEMASALTMSIDHMVEEGPFVAVTYTGRGIADRPFGGRPASGRAFEVSGATLYRFSRGRIVEEWTYYDALELQRQLGLAYRDGASMAVGALVARQRLGQRGATSGARTPVIE